MANELTINYRADYTLYAFLLDSVGKVYNTTTTNFETPVDANWGHYTIALSESENTEIYRGNMPAVFAGAYDFVVRKQAGGSPAITDLALGAGHVEWDGTEVLSLDDVRGGVAGAGAIAFVYSLTSSTDGNPIADAHVWATSDVGGGNVLASGTTDIYGKVTFYLNLGTVYIWSYKAGWNFSNPDTEVVT